MNDVSNVLNDMLAQKQALNAANSTEYCSHHQTTLLDNVMQWKVVEEGVKQLNIKIGDAASAYQEAISGGVVDKEAEQLRIKWYKLIDERGVLNNDISNIKKVLLDTLWAMGAK